MLISFFFFHKSTFLLFDLFLSRLWFVSSSAVWVGLSPQEKDTPPLTHTHTHTHPLITRVCMRCHPAEKSATRGRRWRAHPGPDREPDIKGRWSETMKLQVRCQLPFETKHSPNPGKTRPVPGIRTNKEEPREEWERRRRREEGGKGGGGVSRPCWQSCITIKDPNSAFKWAVRPSPLTCGVVWEPGQGVGETILEFVFVFQESFQAGKTAGSLIFNSRHIALKHKGFHGNFKTTLCNRSANSVVE